MASPIYIWFEGVTQGKIEGWGSWPGEDNQKGKEGSSLVQAFQHQVKMPRDPSSGLPSGRRQHEPILITKRIDKASPKLYMALARGERMIKVEIKWFRVLQAGGGGQEHYYTTLLEDASIVSIKQWFPNTADKETAHYQHFEDVAIAYRKITWTWVDGGISAEDDWLTE